jgi:hypothetical protein
MADRLQERGRSPIYLQLDDKLESPRPVLARDRTIVEHDSYYFSCQCVEDMPLAWDLVQVLYLMVCAFEILLLSCLAHFLKSSTSFKSNPSLSAISSYNSRAVH